MASSRKRILFLVIIFVFLSWHSFANDLKHGYYYSQLSNYEKNAYNNLYDCFLNCRSECILSNTQIDEEIKMFINRVYYAVALDHPELYWVQTNSVGHAYTDLESSPNTTVLKDIEYLYSIQEMNKIPQRKYYSRGELTDENFIRLIYRRLIEDNVYDPYYLAQNIISLQMENRGVCAAFARCFKYYMDHVGIECIIIQGELKGNELFEQNEIKKGHEWNLVQIDGNWYHVDVTSGLVLSGKRSSFGVIRYDKTKDIDFEYCLISGEKIAETHKIDTPFFSNYKFQIPE